MQQFESKTHGVCNPRSQIGKANSDNDLEKEPQGCCTRGCTIVEIDRNLARFIASWLTLEHAQQQALLTLIGNPQRRASDLPRIPVKSQGFPLSPSSSHRHGPTKISALPPSKKLFSESEWSRIVDHLALSERQVEILYLLIHGENDKQIARSLKISLPTLRTHLQRMYGRFYVSNRTSLVVKLVQLARGLQY